VLSRRSSRQSLDGFRLAFALPSDSALLDRRPIGYG
jgi:hypothetical protein